jgi:hypothetical protein
MPNQTSSGHAPLTMRRPHFYPLSRYNPSPTIPYTQNPTILCALCASAVNKKYNILRVFATLCFLTLSPNAIVHRPTPKSKIPLDIPPPLCYP